MPEIRELESFEDFEDAIHNGSTKDCFKTPVSKPVVCLLMIHSLCHTWSRLNSRGAMAQATTRATISGSVDPRKIVF